MVIPQARAHVNILHIVATKYDNDKLESPRVRCHPKIVKVVFSGLPLLLTLPSGHHFQLQFYFSFHK